jgi:hypothetical protein
MVTAFPHQRAMRAMERARRTIRACERSARVFAQFAPACAVEFYVADCADAERGYRRRLTGVHLISLFVPFLLCDFGGSAGVGASTVFLFAWGLYGMWACMAGNAATWAREVIGATERLGEQTKAHADAKGEQA